MLLTHLQKSPVKKEPPPPDITPTSKTKDMTIVAVTSPGDGNAHVPMNDECQDLCTRVNAMLKVFGASCGNVDLQLGSMGYCCFRLYKFTIVVEAPRGDDCYLKVYSLLYRTTRQDTAEQRIVLMRTALELNYRTLRTFGACLSIDPCPRSKGDDDDDCPCRPIVPKDEDEDDDVLEFNLSFSYNVLGLDPPEFEHLMKDYLRTVEDTYKTLMRKAKLPVNLTHFPSKEDRKAAATVRLKPSPILPPNLPPFPPPGSGKRIAWIHYPDDHARDVRYLTDADLEPEEGVEPERLPFSRPFVPRSTNQGANPPKASENQEEEESVETHDRGEEELAVVSATRLHKMHDKVQSQDENQDHDEDEQAFVPIAGMGDLLKTQKRQPDVQDEEGKGVVPSNRQYSMGESMIKTQESHHDDHDEDKQAAVATVARRYNSTDDEERKHHHDEEELAVTPPARRYSVGDPLKTQVGKHGHDTRGQALTSESRRRSVGDQLQMQQGKALTAQKVGAA